MDGSQGREGVSTIDTCLFSGVFIRSTRQPVLVGCEMDGASAAARRSGRQSKQRFSAEEPPQPPPVLIPEDENNNNNNNSASSETDNDDEEGEEELDFGGEVHSPPDPSDTMLPLSRYVTHEKDSSASQKSAKKRGRALSRPMHKGDDEGREPAKRVKRPPPSKEEDGYDDNEADEFEDDNDEDEEDDDDDEERPRKKKGADSRNKKAQPPPAQSKRYSARVQQNIIQQQSQAASNAHSDEDNDNEEPPAAANRPNQPARVRLSKCWLCTFANCKMAKRVAEFVSTNAGCMDPTIMADQIKSEVRKEVSFFSTCFYQMLC